MTATVKSRQKIKTYVNAALGGALVALVHMMYTSFMEVAEEKWQEEGIPYDVKWEYHQSVFLTFGRSKLMEHGYNPQGWLLRGLQLWHKKVYESALTKIPTDDIQRAVFWRQYDFIPTLYGHQEKTALADAMFDHLTLLRHGRAQALAANKIHRLVILAEISLTYRNIVEDLPISNTRMYAIDRLLLETTMETLEKADLDYILARPKYAPIILQYVGAAQGLLVHLLLRRSHDGEPCPTALAKNWLVVRDRAQDILQRSTPATFADPRATEYQHIIHNNSDKGTALILKHYPACAMILV